ncbi:MAG: helix-turn-helix domain-containing protein [Patescibacteria group bacterium]
MEKQIEQLKMVFNLHTYEARIYLAALNFESANLSDLAKTAKLPRTAAYQPIQNLVSQGFLSIIKIGKRKYYQALSPKDLHYILDRKNITLDEIISDLSKNISAPEKKLDIRYYSGIEGVQIAADIWLENAKTKLGKTFENVETTMAQHGKAQMSAYINKRVQKNIKGRMVVAGNPDSPTMKEVLKKDAEELRKSIVVSPNIYPIKASFAVLDDMVMIYTTRENPFAVLIKNKEVAESLNSIHDMVWDRFNP